MGEVFIAETRLTYFEAPLLSIKLMVNFNFGVCAIGGENPINCFRRNNDVTAVSGRGRTSSPKFFLDRIGICR